MIRHIVRTTWCLAIAATLACRLAGQDSNGEIRLIVRSDDMGVARSINEACIQTVTHGVARSIEVIVPGPWFMDAAERLKQHPDIDVGVHLDLTSEWSRLKWGPVSQNVPSLVDANGHFYPMTRQRRDWPPMTGFLESNWKLKEVKRELRTQIELALKYLPKVSHLSAHMGTAVSTPELKELVQRLANDYRLPISIPDLERVRGFGGPLKTAQEKEQQLLKIIDELESGLWLLIEHPGLDTPEMQAVAHKGYENVAADRTAVTHAFTSTKVLNAIERRGIKLMSYADVIDAGD